MKDLDQNLVKDPTEVQAVKPIKKEHKFMGSMKPQPGHTLFEINLITGVIVKAIFERKDISFEEAKTKNYVAKSKVVMKENCVYISALNEKNAMKKFIKQVL